MRVITGSARGRKLKTPANYDIRPTTDNVKEAVFNIIQFDIEGRRVLDLFAGTGQLGIECLSRGAAEAVFIDQSRDAVGIIKDNLKSCGLQGAVLQTDALQFLRRGGNFDLIFVDPPYNKGWVQKVLHKLESVPLLTESGWLILEHSRHDDLTGQVPAGYEQFRSQQYGETILTFLRHASAPAGTEVLDGTAGGMGDGGQDA